MSQILLTEIQNQAKSLNNRGLLTVDMLTALHQIFGEAAKEFDSPENKQIILDGYILFQKLTIDVLVKQSGDRQRSTSVLTTKELVEKIKKVEREHFHNYLASLGWRASQYLKNGDNITLAALYHNKSDVVGDRELLLPYVQARDYLTRLVDLVNNLSETYQKSIGVIITEIESFKTKSVVIGHGACGLKLTLPAVEMIAQKLNLDYAYSENLWFIFESEIRSKIELDSGTTIECLIDQEHGKDIFNYHEIFEQSKLSSHRIPKHYRETVLVEVVNDLGEKFSEYPFKIIQIPFDVEYGISQGEDGSEWIAEVHRTWQ